MRPDHVRFACLALLLAGCGTTNDDRPLTVEYVTAQVLAPTCGGAACHSTFGQNYGMVFDTVSGVRTSIVRNGLVKFDGPQYDPAKPGQSDLIVWLTQIDPKGRGIGRMPWDAPMPNADIAFLERWVAAGAPGAQCDPETNAGTPDAGHVCNDNQVVHCNADWTFGATVTTCPVDPAQNLVGCIQGVCR
jgi:hypothetical protein